VKLARNIGLLTVVDRASHNGRVVTYRESASQNYVGDRRHGTFQGGPMSTYEAYFGHNQTKSNFPNTHEWAKRRCHFRVVLLVL